MKQLFALLAASTMLSLAAPAAQAQTLRELMEDIGLQKREQPRIDYSERAPLVLPPDTSTLPPPEQGSPLAEVNPNWPTDPDDIADAEALEREKIPQHLRRKYREDAGRDIYDIQRQQREQARVDSASGSYDTAFDRKQVLSPDELKQVRDKRSAEGPQNVYVEPERKRLTDPPPGYRMPSTEQPYGPGQKEQQRRSGWLSKINPFD